MAALAYETSGQVYVWTDKTPDVAGFSTVEFRWKASKERIAFERRFCYAKPLFVAVSEESKNWQGFVSSSIADFQQGIMHEFVTKELEAGNFSPVIPVEYFTAEYVLFAWIAKEEDKGKGRGRLSGEQIATFFDGCVKDILIVTVAEKKGFNENNLTSEQGKILQQQAAQYRALLMKLATSDGISMVHLNNAAKALELAVVGNDSDMIIKGRIERSISGRIAKMQEAEGSMLESL